MLLLERAIAALSPRWAAQRAYYRTQLEIAGVFDGGRGYDAARGGRRQAGWLRASTSANAEIAGAGTRLRDSAREMVRNHPHAKRAKRVYIANLVGTGIVPTAATGSRARDRKINDAFQRWCEEADADGLLDFFGLQGLVAGTLFESGETLVRYRDRRPEDGLAVPLQLQVLEPDYLDVTRFGRVAGSERLINQGIEFDAIGRRLAYYLWSQHPGDMAATFTARPFQSRRVPAEQIAHVFRVDRPGQIRGVTELAAAMQLAYDLAEVNDAEVLKRKVAASFGAFVKRPTGAQGTPLTAGAATKDSAGNRIETLRGGIIQYLGLDEDVVFPDMPSTEGYADYTAAQLHALAAGWGVTYEELTGDLSRVNYSSYRAGQNAFRRAIEMDQWSILIPMFCRPTWQRFIDRLYIAGTIDRPHYGVEWGTPRWESIDEGKDAQADRTQVRAGLMSLYEAIRRRGYDPETVLREQAAAMQLLDELGLVLDSDPRKVSATGIAQGKAQATADGPADAGADKEKGDDAQDED